MPTYGSSTDTPEDDKRIGHGGHGRHGWRINCGLSSLPHIPTRQHLKVSVSEMAVSGLRNQ